MRTCLAPDGSHPLDLRQAQQVRTWSLAGRSGFYALTLADSRHDVVAANISRLESDLTPASDDKLKLWQVASSRDPATLRPPARPPAAPAATVGAEESIHNLWWYAMCLLFPAVVTESVVSSRYLNTLQESSS